MDSIPNNLCIHSFSAFKKPELQTYQIAAELEAYAQEVVGNKKQIPLLFCNNYGNLATPFVRLLADILYSLKMSLLEGKMLNTPQSNCMTSLMEISVSMFKNVCLIIQQGLIITESKYLHELTLSMLFEKSLTETLRLCLLSTLFAKNTRLSLVHLDEILNGLKETDYRKTMLLNIYVLHSGNAVLIQRNTFEQTLKCVITNISKTFTEKSNFITRNLKNTKKCKFITQIVSSSVKTICNYKNEQYISSQLNLVTQSIFQHKQNLSQYQFSLKMSQLFNEANTNSLPVSSRSQQSKQSAISTNILHILYLYLDLLRVEMLMLADPELQSHIIKQKQVDSNNFYTQQMQKLLKKCPYNGDECCDCKKCQCVRRNRESAKLSQQKKRNAFEQLDPMKKRIQQLQEKNRQLQQQNILLRAIVNEIKQSERTRRDQTFRPALQSVSKVLHD